MNILRNIITGIGTRASLVNTITLANTKNSSDLSDLCTRLSNLYIPGM